MIKVNIMASFSQQLQSIEKGWKSVEVADLKIKNIHVLRKETKTLVIVDYIDIFPAEDLLELINEYFQELISFLKSIDTEIELFLPGGDDAQLPDFFEHFCNDNKIKFRVLTPDFSSLKPKTYEIKEFEKRDEKANNGDWEIN